MKHIHTDRDIITRDSTLVEVDLGQNRVKLCFAHAASAGLELTFAPYCAVSIRAGAYWPRAIASMRIARVGDVLAQSVAERAWDGEPITGLCTFQFIRADERPVLEVVARRTAMTLARANAVASDRGMNVSA